MSNTIGICGYGRTGSTAYINLLREFESIQLFTSKEFGFSYSPDGLEDLKYHLFNNQKYTAYIVAINRFRKIIKKLKCRQLLPAKQLNQFTEDFLSKIIQVSWYGYGNADIFIRPVFDLFIRKIIFALAKVTRINDLRKVYSFLFPYKYEISKRNDNFDSAAKEYISNILDAMGRKHDTTIVLDQPFDACNPAKSFVFFENPKAIVVNRDPRDHYLHIKLIDRKKGSGYQIPCDNADSFIKYYRLFNGNYKKENNENILYLYFEELVYDYENTINKVIHFTGISNHINKGIFFNLEHSQNNTQLFKKYQNYESDIKKIENELPGFLFPFEQYSDTNKERQK